MSALIRLGAGLVLVLAAVALIIEVPSHLGFDSQTGFVIREAVPPNVERNANFKTGEHASVPIEKAASP